MALSNSQYDLLMRIYEQRQLEDEQRLRRQRQEAYKRIPALQQTEDEISSVSVATRQKTFWTGMKPPLLLPKKHCPGFSPARGSFFLTQGFRKIIWNLIIPAPTAGTPATSVQRSATASRRPSLTSSTSSLTCRGSWRRRISPPSAWNITPATTLTRLRAALPWRL